MELKYIFPILGVIVGWFLNECSLYFRNKFTDKRNLGKVITTLLYLRFEIIRLDVTLEIFKDFLSWEKFERFRQDIIERYTQSNEVIESHLNYAVDCVAEISPLISIELKKIKEDYILSKKTKLNNALENEDVYVKLLSAYEALNEMTIQKLERLILSLSLKYGILTWLKIKRMFANASKEREKLFSITKSIFLDDTYVKK